MAVAQRDVGDVRALDLVGSVNFQVPHQLGIFLMAFPGLGCPWLRIDCLQTHRTHQAADFVPSRLMAKLPELVHHKPVPVSRLLGVDQVDRLYQILVPFNQLRVAAIMIILTGHTQQAALFGQAQLFAFPIILLLRQSDTELLKAFF